MSKFSETVNNDTPRFVVMYTKEGDAEKFSWGVVGQIPILSLIGQISRVQTDLFFKAPDECPEQALVITWDAMTRTFNWFCHPAIPIESLVGMLETIKSTIVATHMARQIAAQQMILGPDGSPMRR